MAKQINWKDLTPTESNTLAELKRAGEEVFEAPLEIENEEQLHDLGLTWKQCRTWYIGSEKVIVHITPAPKPVRDMLLNDLRTRHRKDYRNRRCQIPGKVKPTISCPECNKCSECPYPQYRDAHKPTVISWDGMIEQVYEEDGEDPTKDDGMSRIDDRFELETILNVLDERNPLLRKAVVLKEVYGFSVEEIAERLNTTPRNVYFYLSEAKRIGKEFRNRTK